jgi:hypothetical protein
MSNILHNTNDFRRQAETAFLAACFAAAGGAQAKVISYGEAICIALGESYMVKL